jgi:hypothetical protein
VPAALADSAVKAAAGKIKVGADALARAVWRSMIMAKCISVGATILTVCGISWFAAREHPSVAQAQAPTAKAVDKPKPADAFPFMNDKDRVKDFLYMEIGNMRPLIKDDRGVRFQSREAVLYKDGTAKLWSFEQKDPVAPPLRQKEPIRELTFFDEANCLITLSDQSVKVWDALAGEFRKELEHQTISPLWLSFAPSVNRFVTVYTERKTATVWDAASLNAVGAIQLERTAPMPAVGLSGDGKTVVTFHFAPAPAIELWDVAAGTSFATLRPPSPVVAQVFTADGKDFRKAGLLGSKAARDTAFWEIVRSLAPASR